MFFVPRFGRLSLKKCEFFRLVGAADDNSYITVARAETAGKHRRLRVLQNLSGRDQGNRKGRVLRKAIAVEFIPKGRKEFRRFFIHPFVDKK